MEKVILELYERSLQYNNRSDSIYWIYSIESKIVRRNNIMKRFLTVRFFNRMMNENNNLMRIYLKVNDEEIKADQFVISKQYQNKNILGFAIERDLEDESVNVEITGYIIDGKKVELSEEYIQDIDINLDQEKLNVLQQLYKDNKVIVVPTIHENYWICSCGYYNKKISKLCLSCGTSINTINQMLNSKNTDLLDNIISQIKVSLDEDIEETIENFSQKLNSQYGIDKNTVLQYIDVNQLNIEQEKIKNKTIHEYIESHPVLFSDQISFDDNIDKYCQGLDFKTIHKDDVKKCLELDRLKQEYDTYCQKKQKRKKLTKRGLIISLVICIVLVGSYAGRYIYNHYFREFDQVTVLNTLENRKKLFDNNKEIKKYLSECEYDEIKSIINDNKLCVSDKLYSQKTPKIKIEEIDDKRIRSLGDDYFLVEETKRDTDKSTAMVYYYLTNNHLQKLESPLNCNLKFFYDDENRVTSIYNNMQNEEILRISYEGNKVCYENQITGEILKYNTETKNYEYNKETKGYQSSYIKNGNTITETRTLKNGLELIDEYSKYQYNNQIENQMVTMEKCKRISYYDYDKGNIHNVSNADVIQNNYFYDTNGLISASINVSNAKYDYCTNYYYDFGKGNIYTFNSCYVQKYDMASLEEYLTYNFLSDCVKNGVVNKDIDLLNITKLPTGNYKKYDQRRYTNVECSYSYYSAEQYEVSSEYTGKSGKLESRTYSSENIALTANDDYINFGKSTIKIKDIEEDGDISFIIQYDDNKENIHYFTNEITVHFNKSSEESFKDTFNWTDSSGNSGSGEIQCIPREEILDKNLGSKIIVTIYVEKNVGENIEFINDIFENNTFLKKF